MFIEILLCSPDHIRRVVLRGSLPMPDSMASRLGYFRCFFLKNKAIPHRLDVGFAPFFPLIKGGSPFIINYTSPHPLKSICSITQSFWVFTFCLNFLGN